MHLSRGTLCAGKYHRHDRAVWIPWPTSQLWELWELWEQTASGEAISDTTTELCDYHNQHRRLCYRHKQHPTSFQCCQHHCRYVNIISTTAELNEDHLLPLHRIIDNMLSTAEVRRTLPLRPLQDHMNTTATNSSELYEYDHNQHHRFLWIPPPTLTRSYGNSLTNVQSNV